MNLRTAPKNAAIAVVALLVGLVGGSAAPALARAEPKPVEPQIPHCLVEDGGPQPVCIWDSAVDGNRQPAAPNNVVILYVSRPGQDPEAFRLK